MSVGQQRRSAVLFLGQQLLALLTFCAAQTSEDNGADQAAANSGQVVWVVIGVIATTTFCVLIVLVPTVLYYKYINGKSNDIDAIKK